jgi:hypothetical protein
LRANFDQTVGNMISMRTSELTVSNDEEAVGVDGGAGSKRLCFTRGRNVTLVTDVTGRIYTISIHCFDCVHSSSGLMLTAFLKIAFYPGFSSKILKDLPNMRKTPKMVGD